MCSTLKQLGQKETSTEGQGIFCLLRNPDIHKTLQTGPNFQQTEFSLPLNNNNNNNNNKKIFA
jgi:hypothetical protein